MKKIIYICLAFSLVLLLGACGQPSVDSSEEAGENTAEANGQEEQAAESAEPITIQHALGKVTLSEPPKRIVALGWVYVEDLLALDIQPVGAADIAGYQKWVKVEKALAEDVTDVGTRQEPNLETIAQLNPDLIITSVGRHEGIQKELETIAPTLFFQPYPGEGESISQYEEMEQTFLKIAAAVGKKEQAEQVLAELEAKYEEAKTKLEQADLPTRQFVLTQAYSSNQAPVLRVFTTNALASVIMEKIGLQNAYEADAFEVYGFSNLNVEALTKLEDANFVYVVQDDDNVFENQLKNNDVWNNLAFVEEGRTYPLGGDAWLFGGPLSAKTLVDRIVSTMVAE